MMTCYLSPPPPNSVLLHVAVIAGIAHSKAPAGYARFSAGWVPDASSSDFQGVEWIKDGMASSHSTCCCRAGVHFVSQLSWTGWSQLGFQLWAAPDITATNPSHGVS